MSQEEATPLTPWLIAQFERLALLDPARMETMIRQLFELNPDLRTELAAMAVDEELVDLEEAAAAVGMTPDQLRAEAQRVHQHLEDEAPRARIAHDTAGVARLVGHHVAVWEVVREYRRAGSVDGVLEALPNLDVWSIRAALSYAGRNPDEIGRLMKRYEDQQERAKAAYPFASN